MNTLKNARMFTGKFIKNNLANTITISRLLFVIILPLIIFYGVVSNYILFFICFFMIHLTDDLDGYVARKLNIQSELGKYLDLISDRACDIVFVFTYIIFGGVFFYKYLLLIYLILRFVPMIYISNHDFERVVEQKYCYLRCKKALQEAYFFIKNFIYSLVISFPATNNLIFILFLMVAMCFILYTSIKIRAS